MKTIIAFAALLAVVVATPQGGADKDAVIVQYSSDTDIEQYNYGYETSNGITAQEAGQLKNVGTDNEGIAVSGQYSFRGLDGTVYTVTYTADENGFVPQGAHLPRT